MTITLTLKPGESPAELFTAQLELAKRAENFVAHYHDFCNRSLFDCRMRDENNQHINGNFARGAKGYQTLLFGTQKEADRGLLISTTDDYYIKNYSTGFSAEPTDTPSIAYDWQENRTGMQAASKIAIVRGRQSGEAAVFFFPLNRGFYVWEVGGRYRETTYYFFEGNPDDLLEGRARNPRPAETTQFFKDRTAWPKWHEVPAEVSLTYDYEAEGKWINPRPVRLCDLHNAFSALHALGHLGGS